MKVMIDGREIQALNDVCVIYEDQLLGMSDRNQEVYGQLHVKLTSEGMIADVIEDGSDEVDRSMWQETTDIVELCH
jgi:hypothetical protein